jgi:hypothetical protein
MNFTSIHLHQQNYAIYKGLGQKFLPHYRGHFHHKVKIVIHKSKYALSNNTFSFLR